MAGLDAGVPARWINGAAYVGKCVCVCGRGVWGLGIRVLHGVPRTNGLQCVSSVRLQCYIVPSITMLACLFRQPCLM